MPNSRATAVVPPKESMSAEGLISQKTVQNHTMLGLAKVIVNSFSFALKC